MREWTPDLDRPLWVQVAEIIKERIAAGDYKPGFPVPSLQQLMQEFGIGLNTARKVLGHLEDEGLVKKVPGLGTFVRRPEERPPGGA